MSTPTLARLNHKAHIAVHDHRSLHIGQSEAQAIIDLFAENERLRAGVAAENEACARIAAAHAEPLLDGMYWNGVNKAAESIAASIRARIPAADKGDGANG